MSRYHAAWFLRAEIVLVLVTASAQERASPSVDTRTEVKSKSVLENGSKIVLNDTGEEVMY